MGAVRTNVPMASCGQCGQLKLAGEPCHACALAAAHPDPKCRFRAAVLCRVAIECDHGHDVCPVCDPCTCQPTEAKV